VTPARRFCQGHTGITLLELLLVISLGSILAAIAVPQSLRALDDFRTRAAAQYLARVLASARFQAIKRSTMYGIRFEGEGMDYRMSLVADGNGNGLRSAEITSGVDLIVSEPTPLRAHFAGVAFGILPGVPDADGNATASADGVRVGASRLLAMNADGSATAGTLYLHGTGLSQYAVRVLGTTARIRIVRFDAVRRRWVDLA
jgi:prepilin-type N-terminal cleavage/methylation domain-containing protein